MCVCVWGDRRWKKIGAMDIRGWKERERWIADDGKRGGDGQHTPRLAVMTAMATTLPHGSHSFDGSAGIPILQMKSVVWGPRTFDITTATGSN